MDLDGEFFGVKKREYNEKQGKCIIDAVNKLDEIKDNPLMMLGKIQSGKTKSFIGVISLAFDNGYDLAVVLTKNSNALAMQTTARMKQEFAIFREDDLIDIFDIMCMPADLSRFELDKKLILVVKKEHNNLPKLLNFIKGYALDESKKCLIIDDEADFCSIGYEMNKDTEIFDLRKIASQINDLRLELTCRFIQVTATPYSLYLQPETINLGGDKDIKPVKPATTVLVPYGDEYIGGEYYFNEEKNSLNKYLFYSIDDSELEIIKNSDRRRFKEEEIFTSSKVEGLRTAVINFIIGGCIRIIQNGGKPRGSKNKFSFIIHTEISKSSHKRQNDIIAELMEQLEKETEKNSSILEGYIEEGYKTLSKSVDAYNFEVPPLNEVKKMVYIAISEQWITKTIVNSENDINALLNEDGQLRLRTPLNMFIGGQILDRGITISNLIGFYYGRRPQKMQQDTVLQHSRMFGYRSKKDLAVTRLYTTTDLYDRMAKINEFDSKLREDFEQGHLEKGVVFISRDENGKIIPCSPEKIKISNTQVLKPGKTSTIVGFQTGYKSYIKKDIEIIDKILMENNNGKIEGTYKISKEEALKIISIIYKTIELESKHAIDEKTFLSLINFLSHKEVNIFGATNRNINRLRRTSRYYSDMPYNRDHDLMASKKMAQTEPTLMLMKQNGLLENGWRGAEFYWPVLVVPENIDTAVYSASEK